MAFVGLMWRRRLCRRHHYGRHRAEKRLEYQQQVSRNKAIVDAQNAAYAIEDRPGKDGKEIARGGSEGRYSRSANLAAAAESTSIPDRLRTFGYQGGCLANWTP